jgi:hypothetical protein
MRRSLSRVQSARHPEGAVELLGVKAKARDADADAHCDATEKGSTSMRAIVEYRAPRGVAVKGRRIIN